jgi:hypothetical protein
MASNTEKNKKKANLKKKHQTKKTARQKNKINLKKIIKKK